MSGPAHFQTGGDAVAASFAANLARYGLGVTERGALRAFWHSTDVPALRHRLGAALSGFDAEMAATAAQPFAALVDTAVEVVGWELSPDWPAALCERWLALRAAGAVSDVPARIAAVIVSVLQAELVGERGTLSTLDAALLQIMARVGLFIAGALAGASSQAAARALWLAEHVDPASGLPNRAAMRASFVPGGADEPASAMLAVSLQWAGSAILLNSAERDRARIEIGKALEQRVRADDHLFRVGDDEWVLWAPRLGRSVRLELAAAALIEAGGLALRSVGLASHASLSVGGALTPEDGDTADQVFNAARRARVAASRDGRSIGIAGPEFEVEWAERVLLEREFMEALRNNAFTLHLQPIIQLSDGECRGAEALLRWQRDDGQAVSPPRVVAMAEQFGLMQQLTRLVLQRAAAMLAELGASGVMTGVAVNLAGGDLLDAELPEFVAQALATWRVAPDRLTLELTEGSMIADDARTMGVIARLRDAGYGVALDDFGTGYSSLAWLRRLPATRLKIDRMFVHKMPETAQDRAIVQSVVQLAQGLGLSVVAEGVERDEQLRMLMAMGCDAAQGFLIARPMPVGEFVAWVKAWNADGRRERWPLPR